MKKILRKLVSAGICGFGAACSPVSRSETDEAPKAAPPLPYCELANHPEKYDGQTVRVTATLYFMMHGYKFMDKNCLGDEKETAVLLNAEHEAKLAGETGSEEYNPWSFPTIIATGKFRSVTPSRKSDSVEDNSDLIFEMEVVEGVIK
jgi:hypothetical protein